MHTYCWRWYLLPSDREYCAVKNSKMQFTENRSRGTLNTCAFCGSFRRSRRLRRRCVVFVHCARFDVSHSTKTSGSSVDMRLDSLLLCWQTYTMRTALCTCTRTPALRRTSCKNVCVYTAIGGGVVQNCYHSMMLPLCTAARVE